MAQGFMDESYFIEKYLTQTISDYSKIVNELKNYNHIADSTKKQLETSIQSLSNLPSDKEWADLTSRQQQDITDAIFSIDEVQKQISNQVKSGTGDKGSDKIAKSVWQKLLKGANSFQMYAGTIKAKGHTTFRPSTLSGAVDAPVIQGMQSTNKARQAQNAQVLKKVGQLRQNAIYPPAPQPQTVQKPQSAPKKEDGKVDKGLLTNVFQQTLDGLTVFERQVQNFTGQMGQAYQTMMNAFGNILDSPLESSIGMIQGMGQMIGGAYQMIQGLVETVLSVVSSVFSIIGGQDDSDNDKKNSQATNLMNQVIGVISAFFNMAIQAIQAGFNIFASTLQAVFKIVKKIQETSPIIRQILELLNLAFTLFFMPFMNQFALLLIDKVVQLLDWAVETGQSLQSMGGELFESMTQQGLNIEDIMEAIKEIAIGFITDFLPKILELIPDIIDFAIAFANTILDNKEDLLSFIKTGLSAFKGLIDNGMLPTFLSFGSQVMKWMQDNAVSIINFLGTILNQALNIASFFMSFTGGGSTGTTAQDIDSVRQDADSAVNNLVNNMLNTNQPGGEISTDDLYGLNQQSGIVINKSLNGGIPVLAGEANENEYKFTDSELREIGKDTNVVVQYNGSILSKSDFKQLVRTTVSDVSNKSYFR